VTLLTVLSHFPYAILGQKCRVGVHPPEVPLPRGPRSARCRRSRPTLQGFSGACARAARSRAPFSSVRAPRVRDFASSLTFFSSVVHSLAPRAASPPILLIILIILRLRLRPPPAATFARLDKVDAAIASFWSRARDTAFVRWDSFEPALVLTTFTLCLLTYWALDECASCPLRAYRLQPIPVAARRERDRDRDRARKTKTRREGDREGEGEGEGGETHEARSREIWTPDFRTRDGFQEFALYLVPLLVFDWLYPRRALPVAPPSTCRLALDVVASLAVYDALFSATHRAMHRHPAVFRRVHAKVRSIYIHPHAHWSPHGPVRAVRADPRGLYGLVSIPTHLDAFRLHP